MLDASWLRGKRSVCVTAGASTPEELIQEVMDELRHYATLRVSTMDGIVENGTIRAARGVRIQKAESGWGVIEGRGAGTMNEWMPTIAVLRQRRVWSE